MKSLARRIALEVTTHGHCGVYEKELNAIWPISDKDREEKIKQFAEEYGFRLRFYHKGLCAIFDRPPELGSETNAGKNPSSLESDR